MLEVSGVFAISCVVLREVSTKPLTLKDVPKVVQAMRQTQSRKVLVKLLMHNQRLSPITKLSAHHQLTS